MTSARSKMSPQGRKLLGRAKKGDRVKALVQLTPHGSPETLADCVARFSAGVISWNAESRLLTLSIDAEHLGELARESDVTYIEVGGSFAP